jgi:hypothetical protein
MYIIRVHGCVFRCLVGAKYVCTNRLGDTGAMILCLMSILLRDSPAALRQQVTPLEPAGELWADPEYGRLNEVGMKVQPDRFTAFLIASSASSRNNLRLVLPCIVSSAMAQTALRRQELPQQSSRLAFQSSYDKL